jgi:hypothetical protein
VPPATDPGQNPLPDGATTLGSVDLAGYCKTAFAGMFAVLRFPNTWGWRCAKTPAPASGNQPGDFNINVDYACAVQYYGQGALSHYRNYTDPNSWFCYRA